MPALQRTPICRNSSISQARPPQGPVKMEKKRKNQTIANPYPPMAGAKGGERSSVSNMSAKFPSLSSGLPLFMDQGTGMSMPSLRSSRKGSNPVSPDRNSTSASAMFRILSRPLFWLRIQKGAKEKSSLYRTAMIIVLIKLEIYSKRRWISMPIAFIFQGGWFGGSPPSRNFFRSSPENLL